jgi:amino acid adenylation domain-containing protein
MPTLSTAERLALLELAEATATVDLPAALSPIEPADRSGPLPLSFAQQRLWFLEQLGSAGAAYHVSTRLRLKGELHRDALVHALDRVVARHEALRTTFHAVDGEPVQRIAPAEESRFNLIDHDLRGFAETGAELRRLAAEEAAAPFDLERGPLIRGRLVRVAGDDHVLLVTMHHIVSDGWSMGVLTRELGALYAAFRAGQPDPLPPLPLQYADYAAWQRRWVDGEVLQAQADYWRETLAGAPELLELPADHPRPARQDFSGGTVGIELDVELTAGLKALGHRQGTTLFMTLLAGWAVVLSRLSGQEDVVIGSPMAGRGRQEADGLIGFFVNTLALRVDLSGSPSVAALLARVKERSVGAQKNQDIPFEQVVDLLQPARSLAHTPLFQVMFTWQNAPGGGLALPGLEVGGVGAGPAAEVTAKFDLSLVLSERGGRIAGVAEYAASLLERETVERWLGYLRQVLEEMVADEGRPVERLALMPQSERARVVEEWNRTDAEYPGEACVHQLFEARVERAPEACAVVFDGGELSYAELNGRANRLAHHLHALGVGPDVRVALAMPRSPELVQAELAVLKCGGVYVPLDPEHPTRRLREVLADSAPAALLTTSRLAERFAWLDVPVLALDADAPAWASLPSTNPAVPGLTSRHLAYVMYTSGSTGRPKGVMVPHRAIVRLVVNNGYAAFGPDDRVAFAANPSFDATTMEVWAPLVNGGRIVVIGHEVFLDPDALARRLREQGVTALFVTTAVFNQYAAAIPGALAGLRYLLTGGERADPASFARVVNAGGTGTLIHCYGPTETTTFAVAHEIREVKEGARSIPLGRPIGNTRVYLLDRVGAPVPVGVAGEMYIGGDGVALGYLDRPGLTAERFIPDPFGGEAGARLYRTGDLARWRESAGVRECGSAEEGSALVRECVSAEVDPGLTNSRTHALTHSRTGVLEFLGRTDFQVKIRGFRIEPGEIEARLHEHAGVRESVVRVREDAPGDRRLVAYWVGAALEADALRAHLAERLPEHLVPAAYVRLDALPLTPNGKVDRRALPAPDGGAFATRAYEAPLGEAEEALAGVWSELLRVERVGRRDHFFDLGGHSLLAVRVVSRVREALGVEAAIGDLFVRPVLADFARGLEAAVRAELPPIEPADRGADLPLSFAQQRLWFLDQIERAGAAYHIPTRLRLQGALDRVALARALDRIVARHEALCTTFAQVDGRPVQRIAPAEESPFHLVEHDLSGDPRAEAELRRVQAEEAVAPFDLARGPVIRGRLVRLAADDHVLLLTLHHVVGDGWSIGVLTRELSALYAAFHAGDPDPLPPLPVQYADYAAWQRRWVEGEVLRTQADYWTRTLSGAPELLELPTDHPRPARQDFAGATAGLVLDEELTAALKTLSRRHGTTLFMTVLAGWATVLSRLSGQDDVVVGTPTANRGRREIEGLIGFFVNTLALRVDLAGSPTVGDVLGQVKARALEAQHHQDIPFEQVVELVQPARSLAHTPLFQVMLAWQNAPGERLALPGLTPAPAAAAPHVTAKFDLILSLGEGGGRIGGALEYATALFERETVERWLGYLRRVLEAMAADDAVVIDRIPMLAEAERHRVLREWNATAAAYPSGSCVHELFEEQAGHTPGAVAVVFEGEPVAYAELNARANRLAHHLRALGVGPDTRVGICVERSVEMVVGLLGILKAGGAYVPLDASYPVDRLRCMLADSAPAVLLTHPPLAATVAELSAGSAIPVLDLTGDEEWSQLPATNPDRGGVGPGNLAHVLFTSGSTGRPKGVMLEHGSLVNRLAWMQDRYGMEPHEALLQKTPFSFDVSFWEFFWPLMVGARLVMARPGGHRDPAYLVEVIRREGITVVHFVPSMLPLFLEHPDAETCTGLLRVPVSGEAISATLVRQFHARFPGVGLYNLYGPTETGEATDWACVLNPDRPCVSIGRPITNTTVYVLDRTGQPVPVGVAGELFIGGLAVARGYLGRPRLTADRFVPDPFGEPGARMYRTGDLCRWLPDGNLDFLGRTDFQVKVRGFRVEPGEIEARLAAHPGVRDAVVLALDHGPGGKRLVAYFVGEALESEALRAHLAEQLPEYMVPAAFVRMEAFPLTPNGKLDRKALPAPDAGAFAARGYQAPLGETEEALAGIWAELLGVERVGRGDDFFALGGHSLLAVRVTSRVRQTLGVEAAVGDLFVRPVLADFARGLEQAVRAELPPIGRAERGADIPLSFAQQRLWFIDRLEGVGAAYHLPVRMRLKGELDREALRRALDRIVARHEALRTVFAEVDGQPVQRIAPAEASPFHLTEHDLRGRDEAGAELRRLLDEEAAEPFDLARGPLIRGRLVRLADDDQVILVTMHHIVSDGWSMGVLTRELSALYAAFRAGEPDPLPPLPVQYADYAAWQRRWVDGEVLRKQAEYWKETLAGAPELLELPADHARPARQDFTGGVVGIELDAELTAGLKALGQRHGATLFMTLLAGWATVLARLSGQDDVVVGTPAANRGRSEIEGLIGFFVNTLALRVDLSGAPSVAGLLARVKEQALGAQHHQDIPFEQVVELIDPVRSLSHAPLFQAMLIWQNAPGGAVELPGLAPAPLGEASRPGAEGQATAKFDLSLALSERGGRIVGVVEYAAALFERATVDRFAGYLRRALEAMAADEHQPVERLPLLPDAERRLVLEAFNDTRAEVPREALLHELFQAQAARTPGAVAVVFEDASLTYAQLDERANRLAHFLRRRGVGPEVRVGVCLERSLEMVVSLLGVLKAGGAYVPLDPGYPAERLAFMLADSAVPVLLTQERLRAALPSGTAAQVVGVDGAWDEIARESAAHLPSGASPDSLAYVIYTSGSTGRPKGVMNAHGAVVNRLCWMQGEFGIGADDVVLQKTPFSFDVSVWELFWPLQRGATLVMARPDGHRDPRYLQSVIERRGVTTLHFVPSMLQPFVETVQAERCASLKRVFCSGEALSPALVEHFHARFPSSVALHNLYGPTEAAVDVTFWACERSAAPAVVPIGRPVWNTRLYVLDAARSPVPTGVAGELYIGGVQVARGYLGRPGLTAEKFVPDPFSSNPGARLYRTGDRARWRSALVRECVSAEVDPAVTHSRTSALTHSRTSFLEYLGRLDEQVKIRGFRIEPGEIEARLLEHAGVREAVVLAREDAPGERRLVAYFVGDAVQAETLRAHLGQTLPAYMVPAAFVALDRLPLTPNGKLDRKALPAPEYASAEDRYVAPRNPLEEVLAEVWAAVLRVERVGVRDGFFALGGHSLLATRVVSRIRELFGVELPLRAMFEGPTVAELAVRVEALRRADQPRLPPVVPVKRDGALPLSFAQERLWFLDRMEPNRAFYNIPTALRLSGALDADALERSLGEVVRRHEALRTVFAEERGSAVQVVVPFGGFALPVEDLSALAGDEREAAVRRRAGEEAARPFDLAAGPLFRAVLLRLGEEEHVLLLCIHHIAGDAWSLRVLFRELSALYKTYESGEASRLPPLPVQYADFAVWQRETLHGERLAGELGWWKERLAGAPALLELPTDHPRPSVQTHRGAFEPLHLPPALAGHLHALARREGATLYMVLLAAFQVLLSRYSGSEDVVVGTTIAGRTRAETEPLIGLFMNTLVLRTDLSGDPDFREVLRRVREVAVGAYEHQDVPFERLVSELRPERSLSHEALFQVLFELHEAETGGAGLPGVDVRGVEVGSGTARVDLSLTFSARGGRLDGGASYSTDLFERGTVVRMLAQLRRVLEQVAGQPERRLSRLELMSRADRARVLEWNRTVAAYPAGRCIHQLFEAQAARTPDAPAVVCGGESFSYAQVDARANRLARHLVRLGVGPEVRVGLCLERGPELIPAILGVMKAGGAYVPVDPSHPAERIGYVLRDAGVAVLLTQERLRAGLDVPDGVRVIPVDGDGGRIAAEPAEPVESSATSENLAYVIYTSGSTGRPKGVAMHHRGVANYIHWGTRFYGAGRGNGSPVFSSMAVDLTITNLLPLFAGLPVHLLPEENAVEALAEVLRAKPGFGLIKITPVHLSLLTPLLTPEEARAAAHTLVIGADFLSAEPTVWWQEHAPGVCLMNEYGPTETVVGCSAYVLPLEKHRAGPVPVGHPIQNLTFYVLDAHGEPVPVGLPGELYIGGAGVARGYLGRPALTAEKFVPDPFADAGARMYRSGDRARWQADGNLLILGRGDDQVKIRGYRVELGEVEAVLRRHPAVRACRAVLREDVPGDRRLVAYVVGDAAAADPAALREHMLGSVPEYMVPSAFVRLDALPRTSTGKLTPRMLPRPVYATTAHAVAPRGEMERRVAEVWTSELALPEVGVHDNFFDLGGTSLLLYRVYSRLRDIWPDLPLVDLFRYTTVESLAAHLAAGAPRDGEFLDRRRARAAERVAARRPTRGG